MPFKALHLDKGFTIQLPEWAFFDTNQKPTAQGKELDATYTDAHNLIINEVIDGTVTDGMIISCHIATIKEIPAGQGVVKEGLFVLSGDFPVNGKIIFSSDDLEAGSQGKTFEAQIKCAIKIDIPDATTAVVKLDMSPSFEGFDIDIKDMPTILDDDKASINLKDVYLHLDIDNNFPAGFDINADISTFKNGDVLHSYSLANNPISVAAKSKHKAIISQNGAKEDGAKDYLIPDFSSILSPIPDRISLNSISCDLSDDYITITANDNYNLNLNYSINTPLYLDAASKIEYEYVIEDIDLSSTENISFPEIDMAMTVENSCPFRISFDAELLDASGNKINGTTVSTSGAIEAGTATSPVTSNFKLNIKSNDLMDFSAIKLHLTATSTGTECLNKNQGIAFKNITLSIPSGITIK